MNIRIASADAYPNFIFWKPSKYMAVAKTSEECDGPPPVITNTGSKARNVQIESSKTMVVITLFNSGNVTYLNCWKIVAPSIWAAS